MDRLTDLRRLQALADKAGDQAEYAKLEAKIQKTLADQPAPEPESASVTPAPKRGKA